MAIIHQEVRRGLLLLTLVSLGVWIVLVRMADPAQEQGPVQRQSGNRSQGWWLSPADYAKPAAVPGRLAALPVSEGHFGPVKGPAVSISFSFYPRPGKDPEQGRAGAAVGSVKTGAVPGSRVYQDLAFLKFNPEGKHPPAREAQGK